MKLKELFKLLWSKLISNWNNLNGYSRYIWLCNKSIRPVIFPPGIGIKGIWVGILVYKSYLSYISSVVLLFLILFASLIHYSIHSFLWTLLLQKRALQKGLPEAVMEQIWLEMFLTPHFIHFFHNSGLCRHCLFLSCWLLIT